MSYFSFCNDSCFFSNVQISFKRYFTIYVILDFTPYEKNVSFQFLFFINNTYFTQIIFSLFLQYLTYNTGISQVIINQILIAKNSKLTAATSIGIPGMGIFFNGIRQKTSPVQQWVGLTSKHKQFHQLLIPSVVREACVSNMYSWRK